MNTRRHNVSVVDIKPDVYPINAKICRLVEQYPCMYDRSHPWYLKKDAVDKAWNNIAQQMNDSVLSCKERWRNIRTSFARSMVVQNRTKPYYLYDEIKFLAQHITPGVPVPRRAKNANSTANSTINDDESEENDVTMSDSSIDSYATQQTNQNNAETIDGQENSTQTNTTDEDDDMQDRQQMSMKEKQQQRQQQQTGDSYIDAIVQTATNAAEVAPIVQQVCPCPPKKRQRLMQTLQPEVEVVMHDNEPTDQQIDAHNSLHQSRNHSINNNNNSNDISNVAADAEFDEAFLQGLRPEMKAMNFQQKVYFKRRIYELLGEIFPHTNQLPTAVAVGATATDAADVASNCAQEPIAFTNSDVQLWQRLRNLLQLPPTLVPHTAHQNPVQNSNAATVLMPPRLRAMGRPAATSTSTSNANANFEQRTVRSLKSESSEIVDK